MAQPYFSPEEGIWHDTRIKGVSVFFFGVGGWGGVTLKSFEEFGANIVGVCGREDKPTSRAKVFAKRFLWIKDFDRIVGDPFEGVERPQPVYDHREINSKMLRDIVAQARPDLIISAGFPHLIPAEILRSARVAAINFHPGLLPQRAGATPSRSVILNGDSESGLTVHHMTEHFDAGAPAFIAKVDVSPCDTFGDVELKVSRHIDRAVTTILSLVYENNLRFDGKSSRVPLDTKVGKQQFKWSEPAEIISRKIRCQLPRAVIPVELEGRKIAIWRHDLSPDTGAAGEILRRSDRCPVVGAGDGSIVVKSFYDGIRIRPGNIL